MNFKAAKVPWEGRVVSVQPRIRLSSSSPAPTPPSFPPVSQVGGVRKIAEIPTAADLLGFTLATRQFTPSVNVMPPILGAGWLQVVAG